MMADISRKHLIKDETTLMSLELTVIPCPLTLACQHKSSAWSRLRNEGCQEGMSVLTFSQSKTSRHCQQPGNRDSTINQSINYLFCLTREYNIEIILTAIKKCQSRHKGRSTSPH